MIDIGNHAPTVEFSNELLEHSLFEGDVNTLAVLSNWYLENFDFQLPLGCLVKMLHIGSGAGSPLLTRNCVQVRPRSYCSGSM